MNRHTLLVLLLVTACAKPDADAPPAASTTDQPAAAPVPVDPNVVPADTLVLTLGDSTEVWMTAGRVARHPAGDACRERGIELRKGGVRKLVPLLYAQQYPRVRNDSLFVTMSNECTRMGLYTVDPRTGQPTAYKSARQLRR